MAAPGLGISLILTAAGAILAWAVTYEADGVDLEVVGLILFFVGIAGALLSLLAMAAGRRTVIDRQRDVVVDRPVVERERL